MNEVEPTHSESIVVLWVMAESIDASAQRHHAARSIKVNEFLDATNFDDFYQNKTLLQNLIGT